MRGIADEVATRSAHRDAAAFNTDSLCQISWAYGKLKVRRCLKMNHHCCGSAGPACACWA